MATPFTFFRKYAGGLMVVMVILSMMLFTMDSIFSDTSLNLWLLGMLIGSAAFGIAGISTGRWVQWGIGGGILGTVLGLVLPGIAGTNGIPSAVGNFDEERFYDLGSRRAIANQFVSQVSGQGRGATFGFGQQNGNLDLIFGQLMQAEADEMGIDIDSEGVTEFLSEVGGGKLTKERYVEIRKSMSYQGAALDEETFQEILRDEIRGRLAYEMLQPQSAVLPAEPETYFQYFRRTKVRQQIEVASLDVDKFLDLKEIGEPTDAEVEALFEQYKMYFPSNKEPGSPGFLLSHRADLAYLELDSKSVEDSFDPVTDEEIKQAYEDRKETPLIRSIVIPDDEPATDEAAAEGDAKKTDGESTEGDKKPADKKEDGEKTEAKPADEPKADEPKKDAEKADKSAPAKADAAAKTEEAAPVETKEAAPAKEAAESKETPAKAEEVKEQTAKKPVFNQEAAAAKQDETAADSTAKSEDKQESGEAKVDAEDAEPQATDDSKADAAKDQTAPPEAPVLTIPDAPAADKDEVEIEYEYRELDEELSEQLREIIMAERVNAEIAVRLKAAKGEMELLARQYGQKRLETLEANPSKYAVTSDEEETEARLKELRESLSGFYQELNGKLKKVAEKHGFAFVQTGLISAQDLNSSEEFTIGTASEPSDNPMAQSASIVSVAFSGLSFSEQNNAGQMFLVREGAKRPTLDDDSERRFLYWISDISPQHIPELTEPGVRESVVKAWKSRKARDIVVERGEELVKKVKAGLGKEGDEKQTLSESLDGETVTGAKDGVPLARRLSMPFSWLRITQAPQMQFQMPIAEQSIITFDQDGGAPLNMIGDDFMKVIFDDMADEDVKVVPNYDFSTYHVVRVTNRFPTPEIGEDGLREEFAQESQRNGFRRSPYGFGDSPILPVLSRDLNRPAAISWQKSIYEKYQIDLNGDG